MYYNYFDNDIEDDGITHEIIHLLEGDDVPNESIPKTGDILGVLPLKNMVLFPGVLLSVMITRPRSRKLVEDAFKKEQRIAVVCQKESKTEDPNSADLYTLGTTARILRVFTMSDKSIGVMLEGFARIAVDEFIIFSGQFLQDHHGLWQKFLRFIAGIAKHHALIPCSFDFIIGA